MRMRISHRARRALVVAIASVTLAVSTGILPVFAVHDEAFELEGNLIVNSAPQNDWASLFGSTGNELALPADFTASGFDRDFNQNTNGSFNTADSSTFATGSKDTLPISGWQCNLDNNVNSKIDIMNAYAAAYTVPSGEPTEDDQIVYFGLERNVNTGDANVGFWFLQDSVGCESTGGAVTFIGEHRDGDLLIVSAFSNGGKVSTIDVYRWNGGANGALGTDPVASGVDCTDPLTGVGDSVCATANTGTVTTPWPTVAKTSVGNSLPIAQFFEGGLNLTKEGLGGRCFNTFIADTRSSTSLTATLFDFSRGVIGECTSTTETTPRHADGTTALTSAEIPASGTLEVRDEALITVSGVDSFSGTVSFSLCGPFPAASSTLCSTGGVPVGSPIAVTTSPSTIDSATATVTSAGRYCWRADFSGDSLVGVPPSSDARANECFTITPRQSALSTMAGSSPVDFGNPVTDTATLGNTANQPGTGGPAGSTNGSINPANPGGAADGTITFTLYKADCTTLATGTGTNPQTVPVIGNGSYGPVSFTPDAPGIYHWVASYDGDTPNTLGTTHNTECTDGNEEVEVRQIPTEIKTRQSWYPNDTATITSTIGNLGAGGSVVFSLYGNATCTGTPAYTETETITGGTPSQEVGTSNTTFNITTLYTAAADSTASYSWKVVYTPAASDTAHTGRQSVCDAEHFTITYTNDAGTGVDLP